MLMESWPEEMVEYPTPTPARPTHNRGRHLPIERPDSALQTSVTQPRTPSQPPSRIPSALSAPVTPVRQIRRSAADEVPQAPPLISEFPFSPFKLDFMNADLNLSLSRLPPAAVDREPPPEPKRKYPSEPSWESMLYTPPAYRKATARPKQAVSFAAVLESCPEVQHEMRQMDRMSTDHGSSASAAIVEISPEEDPDVGELFPSHSTLQLNDISEGLTMVPEPIQEVTAHSTTLPDLGASCKYISVEKCWDSATAELFEGVRDPKMIRLMEVLSSQIAAKDRTIKQLDGSLGSGSFGVSSSTGELARAYYISALKDCRHCFHHHHLASTLEAAPYAPIETAALPRRKPQLDRIGGPVVSPRRKALIASLARPNLHGQ